MHKNVRKIPYDVIELLQNHIWVGNVRELENTIKGVILPKGEVLEKEHIFLKVEKNYDFDLKDLGLVEMEKQHRRAVFDKVNWDKKKAAMILGISRQTIYAKIQHYSISPG